jgi:hypothetical protein
MDESYEITEQDIEKAQRYLKYHDPENATREKAMALLHDLKSGLHGIAQKNPDLLFELQEDVDNKEN